MHLACTYAEYEALPGVRSSQLAPYLYISPKAARKLSIGDTPAMRFGRLAHAYILESADVHVVPDGGNTKVSRVARYNAICEKTERIERLHLDPIKRSLKEIMIALDELERDCENKGIWLASEADYTRLCAMKKSAQWHPLIGPWLEADGVAEQSIAVDAIRGFPHFPCKARIDWQVSGPVIFDMKTISSLPRFRSNFERYHYAFQSIFYTAIYEQEYGATPDIYIIAVESAYPYDSALFALSAETANYARQDLASAITRFKTCEAIRKWPGISWNWKSSQDEVIIL